MSPLGPIKIIIKSSMSSGVFDRLRGFYVTGLWSYGVTELRSYHVKKLWSYHVKKLRSYGVTKLRSHHDNE